MLTHLPLIVLSTIATWASPPDTSDAPPPSLEAPESTEEQTDDSQPLSYTAAVAELQAALDSFRTNPTEGAERLANALLLLNDYTPELAKDRDALALRVDAMLEMARSQLKKTPLLAAATMDEAIRQAHGDPLPASNYGPGLGDLYEQRLAAMNEQGTAQFEVHCTVRCRVYIDGHETPIFSGPIHLGKHQVWVEDTLGQHPPLRSDEHLSEPGETREISYGPTIKPRPPTPPQKPLPRVAPKWVGVTLITFGVAMLIGGSSVLGAYGTCAVPTPDACQKNFNTLPLAGVLLGLGGAGLGIGSVLVGVDRQRSAHNDALQVTIGWRAQF